MHYIRYGSILHLGIWIEVVAIILKLWYDCCVIIKNITEILR